MRYTLPLRKLLKNYDSFAFRATLVRKTSTFMPLQEGKIQILTLRLIHEGQLDVLSINEACFIDGFDIRRLIKLSKMIQRVFFATRP